MADLEKTVEIILFGTDRLSGVLNTVGTGIERFGSQVENATQPLADVTSRIVQIDAVLAGLAAGALALATTEAGRFGDSFAEISTLISAPADSLDEFRDSILEYSRQSVTSLEGITTATYNIISATGDWENSIALLTVAERLNVAGKGELEDTTRLLVSSMNAYGASVEDASDYSDILFTGVRVGQTTITELSAAIGRVTGLASSASVPFDQLTAAVAGLTGTLGNTALATTQVQGILSSVIRPSEQARDAAASLGIAFNSQALAAMGLQPFLQMVYNATGGNIDVMSRLFGSVEGLNGALVLGADTSGRYAEALAGMADRAGATEEAYERMSRNFALINQNLVNNLRATLIDFGEPYLDEWGLIAGALADVFQGVSIGIDEGAFAPVTQFLEEFGREIARFLTGVADAMPEALSRLDWSGLLQSLEDLGGALQVLFEDFFGHVDLTNAEDLASVVQRIIDGITSLVRVSQGIAEGFGPLVEQISNAVDGFNGLDEETQGTIGNILGLGTSIHAAASAIPLLTAPLNILSGAMSVMALSRLPALATGFWSIVTAIGTAAGGGLLLPVTLLGGALATLVALTPGTGLGAWARENIPLFGSFAESVDSLVLNMGRLITGHDDAAEAAARHTQEMGEAAVAAVGLIESIDADTALLKTVQINVALDEAFGDIDFFERQLRTAVPDQKTVAITTQVDEARLATDAQAIDTALSNEDGVLEIVIPARVQTDQASAQQTRREIEAATPAERITIARIENETELQIATIQAQAEVLQTAFEWQARVDIVEAETALARFEAVATNVHDMFLDTGDVLTAMVGALSDASGYSALVIQEALAAESRRRDELLRLQTELTQAEIALTRARTTALESGNALITINSSGVYPELDMVLQSIVRRAQIYANAEGFSALLGL